MKIVGIPLLSAQRIGNNYKLSVTYTAKFRPFEVKNCHFREAFVVWESDPFDDDHLTAKVGVGEFNPSTDTVTRTMTHTMTADSLDTEFWEAEEIYVVVYLRNIETNGLVKKRSNILPLNP